MFFVDFMSKNVKGFAGKILRVDLSKETLWDWTPDEETLRSYLGGTGIGAKILYDEVPPNAEWSDPANRMTIASGPLGGTSVGGSGTVSIVTKGALTGGSTSVQANGLMGAYMRFSGYDGVVLEGASKSWRYLELKDGKAELRDASKLLGLDTYETYDTLREEYGERARGASVLSIGPAGENLVRWAGVFVDHGHSASHNGTGAIMGSKKLKAIIAFRGKGGIEVAYPDKLRDISTRMFEDVEYFTGTLGGVERSYKSGRGTLPVKNYTTNIWDVSSERADTYGEKYIRDNYQVSREPCWGCRLLHCAMMNIEGSNATYVEEPEYEQMAAWGPVIGQTDVEATMMLSGLTDRLGLENNEAGWLTGWVMECFENGWLTTEQTGGFKINWGDIDGVKKLLHMIANREGFGDVLAEGVKRVSEMIGGPAAQAAIYTMKGNTPRGHDHRTRWAEMFDTCVSNTSTIETSTVSHPLAPDVQGPSNPIKVSTAVAETKGLMQLEDSVGTCRFNTRMNLERLSAAVAAATGWTFTAEEGKRVGLRAVNLMRAFNLRAGIGKEHDRPSARYGSTPVDGPSAGISILPHWEAMLKNYYELMGWDPETGVPLPSTLEGLGLGHCSHDLEYLRK
jgi:aldehyde:ferredoxin oxidoreductase